MMILYCLLAWLHFSVPVIAVAHLFGFIILFSFLTYIWFMFLTEWSFFIIEIAGISVLSS